MTTSSCVSISTFSAVASSVSSSAPSYTLTASFVSTKVSDSSALSYISVDSINSVVVSSVDSTNSVAVFSVDSTNSVVVSSVDSTNSVVVSSVDSTNSVVVSSVNSTPVSNSCAIAAWAVGISIIPTAK